ncbi:MAG: D-3-phosphoglycerate dehydrogenase [Bacillota bacterium]|jgi:D-3-phosphoglycerate dehydrogenase|nr:D-3-phosphoglycerate dehydrogenase [Bacillota bacterium]
MFEVLKNQELKVIAVGDYYVSPETMVKAVRQSPLAAKEIVTCFWGDDDQQAFAARQINVERNGPEAEAYAAGIDEAIEDADVLITHFSPVPRSLIEKGKNLKAILTCRGGLEHICVEAASERNIPVINVIRNAEPVADFALGMILALTRNIAVSHCGMMRGEWMKDFPNSAFTTTLSQLTVGLAGVGNIGMELALRLKALGVSLIAHDEYTSKERLAKNGLGEMRLVPSLEELFREADVVSLHLRLTEENLKVINKNYFSLMKPTAYFINTARGGLVNQEDLIQALKDRTIAGAALDVYDAEPLDADSELLKLDNVLLTPHIAGQTVDAIPKSPFMLMKEVGKIIRDGVTDRIVNCHALKKEVL